MPKYMVVKDTDGNLVAHGSTYSLRDGEEQVGEVEADSVDQATRKAQREAKRNEGAQGQDDEPEDDERDGDEGRGRGRSMNSADLIRKQRKAANDPAAQEQERERANEEARKEEESKEEFEVMADAKGNVYVEGGDSDPSKAQKAKAKPEPPPEPEPASLGKFRAKDEREAVARARGEFHEPSEGSPRGAQTP